MRIELPRSPLSDDPADWDRIARRITADAESPLAEYAARTPPTPVDGSDGWFASWLGPLARRAPWLAGGAAAATLALWAVLPPRPPDPAIGWLEPSVAPLDTAGNLIAGATPPSVEAMMLAFPPPTGDAATAGDEP